MMLTISAKLRRLEPVSTTHTTIYIPRTKVPILSKKGTFRQKKNDPKSQKEYAKWAGGGVGGGVFGGGSIAASDTDIDAMMAAFLSSA